MYQKCPICNGTCTMPPGFYHGKGGERVVCKSCNGSGVIPQDFIPEKDPEIDAK